MTEFLNTAFASFDGDVFRAMHSLAENAGEFFTPFFKIISILGEKGLIFFITSIILMLFSKTRKIGICMFGAVSCGAIITNLLLKDIIARPRPFENNNEFDYFWQFVNGTKEDGYSFPSGHVTATMSAMMVVFMMCNKKWSWIGFIVVLVMGLSRIYLMAHYTTDVLAAIIVGLVASVISFYITIIIYKVLHKNLKNKFCDFCLNWSIFKKKTKIKTESLPGEENE